jgi:3-hydroxybutyryl-CoA dehydratase
MAGPHQFYFEDVVLHGVLDTPGMTITEAHVSLYAGLSQDTPMQPGLVPELLPLCLTPGLGWRVNQPPLAVLAFMGFEWEVLHPVRVGDTIHSRSRTAVKRSMRDGGVIIEERQVINQHGEVVQKGRFTFLVAKRPAA